MGESVSGRPGLSRTLPVVAARFSRSESFQSFPDGHLPVHPCNVVGRNPDPVAARVGMVGGARRQPPARLMVAVRDDERELDRRDVLRDVHGDTPR